MTALVQKKTRMIVGDQHAETAAQISQIWQLTQEEYIANYSNKYIFRDELL